MFLKQKRSELVKAWGYADGQPQQKYSLEKDILEAETLQELKTIKRKLYNNLYE